MSDNQVVPRVDGLSWRQVDEEIVVLDVTGSRYFSFNSAGALLWRHLSDHGPASEAELASVLVEEFSIDEQRAASDVADFVAGCRTAGLLQ